MTSRGEGGISAAWVVVLAGVVAALQVGKLPPALTALQADLGLSLVESGFLLSMVQLAGMLAAVVVGLLADSLGLRRAMVSGLLMLAVASALGSLASSASVLLVLRAIEGMGFLWVTLPAPALIRRLVLPDRLAWMIGVWGTYMPLGTALALLGGPFIIPLGGWPMWWDLFALLSLAMAIWLYRAVPADPPSPTQARSSLGASLTATLSAPGPWLVALMFCVYSAQWLAVVGFLPSIYAGAGLSGAILGVLTALAAGVNGVGNVVSGRLLQAGHQPHRLLWVGFGGMALGSSLAFMAATEALPMLRYAATLLFFSVGGLVPATLFALAVRLASGERQVAGTVGWVLQWSALGQFFGPPTVAWVAAQAGGWQQTHWVTVGCCVLGSGLALLTARHMRHLAGKA